MAEGTPTEFSFLHHPFLLFLWQFLASVYHGMALKFFISKEKKQENDFVETYVENSERNFFGSTAGSTSVLLDLNVDCVLYFFKATYLCLEKSQFQKTIYELYLV